MYSIGIYNQSAREIVIIMNFCYTTSMKLTAKVKLQPTQEQYTSLLATLMKANDACNAISDMCWETKTFGQFNIHKLVYHEIKERFSLSAQVIVRCIAKVCDAYKKDKKTKRTFKPTGSIAFDARILSFQLDKNTVSIWTVDGRLKGVPFVATNRAKELLSGDRGESDLLLMKGVFYLFTSCDVDEPTSDDTDDVLGVDMGIVNVAVDSDKQIFSSKAINNVRFRHRRLRAKLQKLGTKASKRKLRQLSGKERRFAKDANHQISKAIVKKAKDTNRAVAIEELGGIRDGKRLRKPQRTQLHSWSFYQLRTYIEYKAKLVGVHVIPVDPRNTSRSCPCCGHVDKANRKTQAAFLCVDCGFSGLADHVAAMNIRSRALLSVPNVSDALAKDIQSVEPGTSPQALAVGN